jgi:hypothetical protein
MTIRITDNFLTEEEFAELKWNIYSGDFPWYQIVGIDNQYDGKRQFIHFFYKATTNSNYFSILNPIIQKLDAGALIKIKANLIPKTHEVIQNMFHVDSFYKCTTAIFYMNTNNGYTLFEDGTKCESVENRLVRFPSHIKHTGTSCTDAEDRIVINLNYYEAEYHDGVSQDG